MEGFLIGFACAAGWMLFVLAGWMIRAAFSIPLDLGEG